MALDTRNQIIVYAPTKQAASNALGACKRRIEELDTICTVEGSDAPFAQANSHGDGRYSLPDDAYVLLEGACALAHETGDACTPALFGLTHAWGFTRGDYRLPSAEEIEALIPRCKTEYIGLNPADKSFSCTQGAQIDVGAYAKGFVADELMDILEDAGISSALFDLGGNITAWGTKPDGKPWKVGVRDPEQSDDYLGVLYLANKTVSTSGAYQRNFEAEGKMWHHIIDPKTGYSADTDIASVSVVSSGGLRADGLSTALFVMGSSEAQDFWRKNMHAEKEGAIQESALFDYVMVLKDGTVCVTEGLVSPDEGGSGAMASHHFELQNTQDYHMQVISYER